MNNCLYKRSAALGGARKFTYHCDMSHFLCSICFASQLARQIIQCSSRVKKDGKAWQTSQSSNLKSITVLLYCSAGYLLYQCQKEYHMPNTILREQEVFMLREEMEILMNERQCLLDATGAAAVFVAKLDSSILPDSVCQAAKILSSSLNNLPEETLKDALERVKSEFAVRA